ncbi:hypothetical protein NQ315_004517 [Exocentrus adspersus]|uniref:Aquaporin n=1 Tax=Exocentrus adspersus TaxID=1586481 RepID=A0AAV8VQ36_9CUCU|nr:hypothetical protein NQ315_004517 [Exocentrus adspersus]
MAKKASFSKKLVRVLKKVGVLGYRIIFYIDKIDSLQNLLLHFFKISLGFRNLLEKLKPHLLDQCVWDIKSKKKNIYGVHPLVISTAYITLTLLLASLSRKLVKSIFGDSESIFKQILLEFIATLELCASCFELIIVKTPRQIWILQEILDIFHVLCPIPIFNSFGDIDVVADNWGVGAYALYLFLLTIWWSSSWEDASACPYSPIEDLLHGYKSIKTVLFVIVAQVFAALVTFSYVQLLWELELVETHKGKAYEDCTADLQVDMIAGAVIEGVATCICRLISRTLSESNAKFAFNFSGGYFNPALATSLKLGCEGNTFEEHLIVYWLGATVGSILSVFLFKLRPIQNYVKKLKEKQE